MKGDEPNKNENKSHKTTLSGKTSNDELYKEKLFGKNKLEDLSPDLLDENQKMKEIEVPNLALNQLLQKKARLNLQGSYRWKIYLFPSLSEHTSVAKITQTYFGIDLVDEHKDRTYWTHKLSVWQTLFSSVFEMAKTGQVASISPAFNGIISCALQAKANGPNEPRTFFV